MLEVYTADSPKPVMAVKFRVKRRWKGYVLNHMSIIGVMASVGYYSFILDLESFQSRMSITLALLLTMMAAKFVLANSLPKVSYLTFYDKYILACFSNLFAMMTIQMISKRISEDWDPSHAADFDRIASCALGLCWISYHIVVVYLARVRLGEITVTHGEAWAQQPMSIPDDALMTSEAMIKNRML